MSSVSLKIFRAILPVLFVLAACKAGDETGRARIDAARRAKDAGLARLFQEKQIPYPPAALFLRAFKREHTLEIFARGRSDRRFTLIKTYPVCKQSGGHGPKRREGDRQVPEGFYVIDRLNARSRYLLSLGLNYPNDADRVFADPVAPGGDIFIHGDCVSVGCLAMTDDQIQEIFWLVYQVHEAGQTRIPVFIFPFRFAATSRAGTPPGGDAHLRAFWDNLRAGNDFFEREGFPPVVSVDGAGNYVFTAPGET